MTSFAPPLAADYRQGAFFDNDPVYRKCLTAASILGLVFLIAVFLTPRKPVELTHAPAWLRTVSRWSVRVCLRGAIEPLLVSQLG